MDWHYGTVGVLIALSCYIYGIIVPLELARVVTL
jgi:hypothetical protein